MLHFELARLQRLPRLQVRQRLRKALFQLVQPLQGAIVCGGGFAVRDIGRDNQPNLLAHVVEGKHLVEEEQASVRDAQLVLRPHRQPLDLAHGVVGKETDRSGRERRQPLQSRRFVPAERLAQHGKDVAFDARGLAALCDRNLAPPRHNALERREPDEGIAAHLFAALHRFQQKTLALRPGRAQKGRDRRFQVGHQGAADGNERVRLGERQKLLAAGPGGMEEAFTASV